MKARTLLKLSAVAALVCAAAANPARAQAPLEPAQMSPRTLFYLIWRGAPNLETRQANSLLALWDDADFRPVRSAIAAGMLNSSADKATDKATPPKLTPES